MIPKKSETGRGLSKNFQQPYQYLSARGAKWPKWLNREFTNQKVCCSNLTSASRLPLSRLGQPVRIPALVQPSGGITVRRRKGGTVERLNYQQDANSFKAKKQMPRLGYSLKFKV
ncbi:hypothetical protein CSKR_105181 [Clonorchis sinensis]|uniref:Uncharacterized protein n=1 Tax=Clonorchis sinensis TaxID=79923 RepID=A0A3R7CBN9_CLOSI|nr:hypothetical protein CSKR_105181 [Clonorchis sinensis]